MTRFCGVMSAGSVPQWTSNPAARSLATRVASTAAPRGIHSSSPPGLHLLLEWQHGTTTSGAPASTARSMTASVRAPHACIAIRRHPRLGRTSLRLPVTYLSLPRSSGHSPTIASVRLPALGGCSLSTESAERHAGSIARSIQAVSPCPAARSTGVAEPERSHGPNLWCTSEASSQLSKNSLTGRLSVLHMALPKLSCKELPGKSFKCLLLSFVRVPRSHPARASELQVLLEELFTLAVTYLSGNSRTFDTGRRVQTVSRAILDSEL
mmetsp:Transcript_6465/g.15559  ORF Transcript_6465/g.15559 Transcript_6465/m.15559 type:complete len:267 (-) Transcript_6465:131-931(-)